MSFHAVIPTQHLIGRDEDTTHLYECEERVQTAIRYAAKALERYLLKKNPGMAVPPGSAGSDTFFWAEVFPEALAQCLHAHYGVAAALGFLKSAGFDISSLTRSAVNANGIYYTIEGGIVVMQDAEKPLEQLQDA
jgi:hypothetical protein